MHTLHTRAASIYTSWAEEERRQRVQLTKDSQRERGRQVEHRGQRDAEGEAGSEAEGHQVAAGSIDAGTSTLWMTCWCPLLQGTSIQGLKLLFLFVGRC